MQNKKNDWITRLEEIPSYVHVILAIFILALNTVLCAFAGTDPVISGAIAIVIYGAISIVIHILVYRKLKKIRLEANTDIEQTNNVINLFGSDLKFPYLVVNESGKILTVNKAFSTAFELSGSAYGADIDKVCGISFEELVNISDNKTPSDPDKDTTDYAETHIKEIRRAEIAEINGIKFRMECYPVLSKGKKFYIIIFHDITELAAIRTLYDSEQTAIGYIVIDNLEDIAQYVKISYQDETRKIGKILEEWATGLGGVICEYDNNKFLLMLTQAMILECIRNKFSILDEIHKIEIGDAHIPLSISMGIATTGSSLEERNHDALVSLDMALQRGGDQVVLKNPTGIFYYGAKTKTLQKRIRGQGKIVYGKIGHLVSSASNILVMGHKNPDFDSIGACIGITTLIRHNFKDKDVRIVIDKNSDNFITSTSRLSALAEYKDTFIDGVSALEYNNSGTLLIIVDANNMQIVESPELASNCFNTVILDHHIKKDGAEVECSCLYIDPSASSACEMIAELLEDQLPPDSTFKEEANIMLAGIMLDTHNFTRTVGNRTFAAALYLRNAGADPEFARTFFKEGIDEYLSAAQFGSQAKIYRDRIAITCATDIESGNSRVLAAKAADKLLTVKNVSAAFALVTVGDDVHISARSDGSINVQLIVETLGGGGHFDMAGVAIKEVSMQEAEKLLTDAIDAYLNGLSAKEDEEQSNIEE